MSDEFPTDVSLRIEGDDLAAAQGLISAAKNLLYHALHLREIGDKPVVRLLRSDPADGSLVSVFVTRGLKHVYIAPGPRGTPKPAPEETGEPIPKPLIYINDLWSGVVVGQENATHPADKLAHVIIIPNPDGDDPATVPALQSFHPDAVTAAAYFLDFDWQEPPRLGINAAGGDTDSGNAISAFPKPGMYSGAMKRLVSCVLGIGRTITETNEYISEELPASYPDLVVWNQYAYTATRTHGLYKNGDDGGVWLIEISKLNGVLAMPLPIFELTDSGGYMEWLASIGDTDTMAIVFEFGGLPTGEKFPTGSTLADAIADDKVLELAPPTALAEFYRDTTNSQDKTTITGEHGWAFNADGSKASHVCVWYSHPTVALARHDAWSTDGYDGSPANQRYMRSQIWTITLSVNQATAELPASGVAAAVMVEENLLVQNCDLRTDAPFLTDHYNHSMIRVPVIDDRLSPFRCFGRQNLVAGDDGFADEMQSPAALCVFYNDEGELEIVRSYPWVTNTYGQNWFIGNSIDLGTAFDSDFITYHTQTRIGVIFPAYTREGYVIVKYTSDQRDYPFGIAGYIAGTGYFNGYGLFDLTTLELPTIPLSDPLNAYITPWFAKLTNYDFTVGLVFGTTVNTGPLVGMVTHAQPEILSNDRLCVTSDSLVDFHIPDNTPANAVTFIGSCSDG